MNQLLGASIAAGIKCRPYTVSPMTRMSASVQARSFMNRKEGYIPIGKIELDCPQAMKDDKLRVWFGSAFTGEVEKRYLDYLGKLDWESLNNHVTFFPRKHRSKDEKRLIFEKWAAHFGKKYPSAEFKKKRYATFKAELGRLDILNSRYNYASELDRTTDIFGYPFTCHTPSVFPYWLKGIRKPYHSYTPQYFCELTHTHKEEYDLAKERWVDRAGKMYVVDRDNEVYEIP